MQFEGKKNRRAEKKNVGEKLLHTGLVTDNQVENAKPFDSIYLNENIHPFSTTA